MLDLTRAALAETKSAADLYRVQINLQQLATPAEVATLAEEKNHLPDEFAVWLSAMSQWMSSVTPDVPQYDRQVISEHVTMYTAPGTKRALAIAYCGKAGLLFMPTPLILQYLSMGKCDLVVIRDADRMGFVSGVRGYASSFESLVQRLRSDAGVERYRELRAFGTSSGGVPALVAGAMLKAVRAVSFSGHLPSISPRYGQHPGAAAIEQALRSQGPQPDYCCVFGSANGHDVTRAYEIAKIAPMRLLPVDRVSDHNVLFPLHVNGKLGGLLKAVGLI